MKNKLLKYVGVFNVTFFAIIALAGVAGLVASLVLFILLQTGQFQGAEGLGMAVYFILSLMSLPVSALFIGFGVSLCVLSVKAIKYSQNVNTVDYKKKLFKKYAVVFSVFTVVAMIAALIYAISTKMNIVILIIGAIVSLICIIHFILLLVGLKRNRKLIHRFNKNQVELI